MRPDICKSLEKLGHGSIVFYINWFILASIIVYIGLWIINKYKLCWIWIIPFIAPAWLSGWFANIPIFLINSIFGCSD